MLIARISRSTSIWFVREMANYKQILYYLKIFDRLHHVTKSIKLVAFTKFKKIQHRVKILSDSFISLSSEFNPASIATNLQTYLIVPITSDKGCCGAINTHLVTSLDTFVSILRKYNKRVYIILIGKKGKKFVKRAFKGQYIKYVTNVFNSTLSVVSTIKIVEEILKVDFDKCVFLFNHFININEQKVYTFDILSLQSLQNNLATNNFSEELDFSILVAIHKKHSNGSNILSDLYSFVISLMLLYSLLDHEISELGGRITSMEKSSQNALEMFNSLQIDYNKARQSYITNQLIEICSASTAINVAVL